MRDRCERVIITDYTLLGDGFKLFLADDIMALALGVVSDYGDNKCSQLDYNWTIVYHLQNGSRPDKSKSMKSKETIEIFERDRERKVNAFASPSS